MEGARVTDGYCFYLIREVTAYAAGSLRHLRSLSASSVTAPSRREPLYCAVQIFTLAVLAKPNAGCLIPQANEIAKPRFAIRQRNLTNPLVKFLNNEITYGYFIIAPLSALLTRRA